jgi:hypothetical protein
MRRTLCCLAFLLVAAAPAWPAVKACNASRVSAGDCTSAGTQTILLFAFATADLLELADEIAEQYGWPTITCTAADVAASPVRCTSGQLGQVVTTPETKTQFGNRMLTEEFRRRIHNRRKRLAAASAEAGAPLPGAIE